MKPTLELKGMEGLENEFHALGKRIEEPAMKPSAPRANAGALVFKTEPHCSVGGSPCLWYNPL